MTTKHLQPLTDFLREAGAKNVRLEHGGKHPRLVYHWQGRDRFYVVSNTPGEPRAMKNALADLRRALRPIGTPMPEPRRIEQPAYQSRPPLTGWGDPPPAPQPMQTAMLTIIDAVPPHGFDPPPPAQPIGDKDMTSTEIVTLTREGVRGGRDGLPAQHTRQHAKVPVAEVQPLLDRAIEATATDEQEVLRTIGYSYNTAQDWQRNGQVRLTAKYALLGLLSTLEVPPPQAEPKVEIVKVMVPVETLTEIHVEVPVEVNPFTFDETTALFGVLNGFPVEAGVRRGLIGKLAQELARA